MKILLKNGTIFTQNAQREILQQADILIDDSRISDIGFNLTVDVDQTIDVEGKWMIPGLINSHVHLGESAYAAWMSGRYGLSNYLEKTESIAQKFDLETKRSTIAAYSLLQLIRSGTTTVAGGRTRESSSALGVRDVSGYMLMQSRKLEHFSENFGVEMSSLITSSSGTSHAAIFIHSLATVDEALLCKVSEFHIKNPEVRIMLHVGETADIVKHIEQQYGKREIDILNRFNLLGPQTLLVHGNHLFSPELEQIAASRASIAHCMSSNFNTADKTLDLKTAYGLGINITIATDGVVTGSDFSVLREAGAAYRYHNRFLSNCGITAGSFLDMITVNAAIALGLQERIGSIEVGKDADISIVSPPMNLRLASAEHLLYYANLVEVRDVMVAGKFLLRNGESTNKNSRNIEREFIELTGNPEL